MAIKNNKLSRLGRTSWKNTLWRHRRRIFIVIAALLVALPSSALLYQYEQSSSNSQVIRYAPYTITKPGYYRVTQNLSSIGHGIVVDSDDVTVDLGGFQISSTFPNPMTARNSGILITRHQNITIRNGTIKGFFYGIYANNDRDYGGNIFENLKLIKNLRSGICARSKNTLIQNNIVSQTTGISDKYTYGIFTEGPGMVIKNNAVFGTYPSLGQSEGVGISLTNFGRGSVVENNTITNSKDLESGRTFGIWVGAFETDTTTAVGILNNHITNMVVGIAASAPAGGVFRDNTILSSQMNFFTNSPGMRDGGNNFGDGDSGNSIKGLTGETLPDYK